MYSPIEDYALIGDMHSAALVHRLGAIDWCCLPHFDSPAIFLRILDHAKGGFCSVQPEGLISCSRRYLPNTNILETTFRTKTGVLVLTDYMPVEKGPGDSKGCDVATEHAIIRQLHCSEGGVQCQIEVFPTFEFASLRSEFEQHKSQFLARAGQHVLSVESSHPLNLRNERLIADFNLRGGERAFLVLKHLPSDGHPVQFTPATVEAAFRKTETYWLDWSGHCRYQGEYQAMVLRSALTLKLLTFEPSGAIVAAPTTSLPEQVGGVRNWDYRFTWLRDAAFTTAALMKLGYFQEASDFLQFLERASCYRQDQLRILYAIGRQQQTKEIVHDHLEGYKGSRPVREGNAAADQNQFDIYGEVIDALDLFVRGGALERHGQAFEKIWPLVKSIADFVARNWQEPDHGIWEFRSGPRHSVHSKGMCWLAMDHALKLARHGGVQMDFSEWEHARDSLYRDFHTRGYNHQEGAFVESYGAHALDAAILRLPLLGVIDPRDERMRSTVEQIERRLVSDGLVYRYRNLDDGLPGTEGAFAICSFWLADNYLLQGHLEKAEALFRKMLSRANDVGLYSEEIDPKTGAFLGNFPQAFTHIALINSAVRLEDVHAGKEPWPENRIEEIGQSFA